MVQSNFTRSQQQRNKLECIHFLLIFVLQSTSTAQHQKAPERREDYLAGLHHGPLFWGNTSRHPLRVAYLRPRLPPEGSISTFTIYIFVKCGLLRALECFFRACQFLSHCFDYFQKTYSHPQIPYLTFRPTVLLLLFSIFIIALAIVKWQKLIHNFVV